MTNRQKTFNTIFFTLLAVYEVVVIIVIRGSK